MMFSIADLQTPEEPEFDEENPDAEREEGEQSPNSYPIRVAFAITKVCYPRPSKICFKCNSDTYYRSRTYREPSRSTQCAKRAPS